MGLEVEGLKRTTKALETKRRYIVKATGVQLTSTLVSPQLLSESLSVARQTLTKTPGKPKYPLRWKSDSQRKAVMAKLRKAGNLPYSRTGKIKRAWKGEINPGELIIANEARDPITRQFYAEYVFGKDQQPFHKDTGWQKENNQVIFEIVQPLGKGITESFVRGLAMTK
jgi:hypothetical protein